MDVKNTVLIVHLQTSCGSRNKAVGFRRSTSCTTKTKFSDVLFQNSKLLLSVSQGLFILNPPSGWGFDKPEVQIPTYPPICPARGVVGLDIDRCIIIMLTAGTATYYAPHYGIPSGTKISHINCNSHSWCQGQTHTLEQCHCHAQGHFKGTKISHIQL